MNDRHSCELTALGLVALTDMPAYRIAKTSRGPMNPPVRAPGIPTAHWARWDSLGRTIYLAQEHECAYAEVLGYAKRSLGAEDPLRADAAALGLTVQQLIAELEKEWSARQHMPPGHLPRGWRLERAMYSVQLPATGWWVDLDQPETLAALEQHLAPSLRAAGVDSLTLGVTKGENRHATTTIAQFIRSCFLDDGSEPLVVRLSIS